MRICYKKQSKSYETGDNVKKYRRCTKQEDIDNGIKRLHDDKSNCKMRKQL